MTCSVCNGAGIIHSNYGSGVCYRCKGDRFDQVADELECMKEQLRIAQLIIEELMPGAAHCVVDIGRLNDWLILQKEKVQ